MNVLGSAKTNATVSLWSPQSTAQYAATTRKGEYYRGELPLNNNTGAVWITITNLAVLNNGSNPDILTNTTGNVFVPKTSEVFQYDRDGNLTNDGRWTYTWDAEHRLVRMVANTATGPQQRIDFEFDAKGRRTGKKVWNNTAGSGSPAVEQKFVYDGWNLIAVLNSSSTAQRSFVWGLDLSGSGQGAGGVGGLLAVNDVANGAHFCTFDGNGNLTALIKATDGLVTANYEYGPFGEALRLTGAMAKANPFRFSTKYQDDETDLLYYGYRSYNSSSGRWLSRDPIEENGGINLNLFVKNTPVNSYDLLGLHDRYYTLAEMDAMLSKSMWDFYNKLAGGWCNSQCDGRGYDWESWEGTQTCTKESCRIQALILAFDIANHLRTAFATQYRKYGNVIAFFNPPVIPWPFDQETINGRADRAQGEGMRWQDLHEGHGLKCQGMQSLARKRFETSMTPFRAARKQCFKGADVGNGTLWNSSHHWFAIYSGATDDVNGGKVHVDPWYSAGGIVSPLIRGTGRDTEPKYFNKTLW